MSRIGRISAPTLASMLIPPADGEGLVRSLVAQLQSLIRDGRVPLDVRLPSERDLAQTLEVSRTSVAAAFADLKSRGYLDSHQGAGTWSRAPREGDDRLAPPWLPGGVSAAVDFSHAALPASSGVAAALEAAQGDIRPLLGGHGYDLRGLGALRSAVARRYSERGLPTSPDQVLITNGAQHAIYLVLGSLAAPAGRVVVDHPTYPGALDVIRSLGLRAVPIGYGSTVWGVEALRETLRHNSPVAIFVVPDNHNPTGQSMGTDDRQAFLVAAEQSGVPLVVDESLTELSIDGEQFLPLASYGTERHATAITIGSASKIFWGGLRVGWVRAEPRIIDRLAGSRAVMDMASPMIDQLAVVRLLDSVEEVRAERQQILATARDQILTQIAEIAPEWAVLRPTGGLNLWVDLGVPLGGRLAKMAGDSGVDLTPGSRFGVDGAFERFIRIPFTLPSDVAAPAIAEIVGAWRRLRAGEVRPANAETTI